MSDLKCSVMLHLRLIFRVDVCVLSNYPHLSLLCSPTTRKWRRNDDCFDINIRSVSIFHTEKLEEHRSHASTEYWRKACGLPKNGRERTSNRPFTWIYCADKHMLNNKNECFSAVVICVVLKTQMKNNVQAYAHLYASYSFLWVSEWGGFSADTSIIFTSTHRTSKTDVFRFGVPISSLISPNV